MKLKKNTNNDDEVDDGVNDLAEMDGVDGSKDQQIEDLKDEIRLLEKNN